MINAIFTALSEDVPNMLLTLLLISLLVIWLQSKFNKEFGGLREEISDGNAALRKEITDGNAAIRKEMTDRIVSLRKEITDGNAALREDIGRVDKDLRKEIGDVSKRLARIEGKLELPAYTAKVQPSAKTA